MLLAACQPGDTAPTAAPVVTEEAQQTEAQVQPTQAPCPTAPAVQCPEQVIETVPYQDEWLASPHADPEAEAFVHWNEDDPAEVPENCAKCHSTTGYQDYIGDDGSEVNVVNAPVPVGEVITCEACHNPTTATMTTVLFPSGAEITGLEDSARCMQCHQGRASKVQVDATLETYGVTEDLDVVPEPVDDRSLGFINIHYYAAAATMYGTMTKGGYEYDGLMYDSKYQHVEGLDTCAGCHDPHTTELRIETCAECHEGVASREDLRNIRMQGSMADYDGDGDLEEGIASEIEGLQAMALTAIQSYGSEVAGAAIGYNSAAHPYWFADPNEDGQISEDEANSDNAYGNWTGRMLKAAYNYQVSLKDPGAYAHGGKYIIQLLHDSIADLNTQLGEPVDLSAAARTDPGHFAGSEEAFRHWDSEEEGGMVPGDCAKCHSGEGLPMFLGEAAAARDQVSGRNVAVAPTNGLNCTTCHSNLEDYSRYVVEQVRFPSGAVLALDNPDSNLCLECHQGRESKASVDAAIDRAGVGDDEVSEALTFRNPHYFATAATLFGTEAKGAYEFDGQEYNGRFLHVANFDTCIECHDSHALEVQVEACSGCHQGVASVEDLQTVRMDTPPVDYDGDGDSAEGVAGEIATMHEQLLAAIQAYASGTIGTPIQYAPTAYPYWYQDPNENGEMDEGEEGYATWTPTLLRTAYNYQWVSKDPGAFAHNGRYILQILYDSLEAAGGDVSAMTRPDVIAPAAPEGE
jgi:hypothetical protein